MTSHRSMLFLVVLLFLNITSLAYGFSIKGTLIAGVSVSGSLYCSNTGNFDSTLPSCPPLTNVEVALKCNVGSTLTVLGQASTDGSGSFLVSVNLGTSNFGDIFDPTVCKIYVPLPIAQCELLSNVSGSLEASITLLGVQTGAIAAFKVGTFSVVSA